MTEMLIRRLHLDGFLTFAPGSEPFELRPLNVLIGANGAGKSNLIEALGLLAAASRDLGQAIRGRGEWIEWLWKGRPSAVAARIEAELDGRDTPSHSEPRCRLVVEPGRARLELVDEAAAETGRNSAKEHIYWYYQLDQGRPVTFGRTTDTQRYQEVSWAGEALSSIRILDGCALVEQSLRRDPLSAPPFEERMFTGGQEAALVLLRMVCDGDTRIEEVLKRFFLGFERLSVRDVNGAKRLYLHESGLTAPIPVSRMSRGTLRFATLLAVLLSPSPPPLLCVEAPERGLHPDAAAQLGEVLVDASRRMQLVVTTHSSELISAFSTEPDAVVACERPGTATELERLDPERLASWLKDHCLGDLWAMGVLGANP